MEHPVSIIYWYPNYEHDESSGMFRPRLFSIVRLAIFYPLILEKSLDIRCERFSDDVKTWPMNDRGLIPLMIELAAEI
jgi:hypothetical protein